MVIETIGRWISGYSRTDIDWTDISPTMTRIREMTAAKTGRRTETSEMSNLRCSLRRAQERYIVENFDASAIPHLVGAFGNHLFAGIDTVFDNHEAGHAPA